MGNESQELKKQQKKQEPVFTQQQKYEQRQQQGWDAVQNFDKTTGIIATKEGLKHNDLGDMTLAGLRDELYFDTYSKSETFDDMFKAVNKLLNLSITKGKIVDENGQVTEMTADFFETYFSARQAVTHYLDTHDGFKFMGNSKRRYQIVTRVQMLLNALGAQILEQKKQLPADKQEEIEGAQMGLDKGEIEAAKDSKKINSMSNDLYTILHNEAEGPQLDEKSAEKTKEEWLKGGYTEELKKLLSGKKDVSKDEKNKLLAALQNKQTKLLAFKMTISLLVDANKKDLVNMTHLKNDLTKYIYSNSPEEWISLSPREYAVKVNELIKAFKKENKSELDKLKKRRTALEKDPVLGSSLTGENIYDNPEIQKLLAFTDDEEFKIRKQLLVDKVKESDAPIIEMLKERGYSSINFEQIKEKLDANLGALRLFGTPGQQMDQANIFCDMLRYVAPEEYNQERQLDKAMKSLKLEGERKEGFVKFVLEQTKKEKNVERDTDWWKKQGEEYSKRVKKNTKSFLKRIEKEGLMLSENRWDLLEKMHLSSGEWENADFKNAIERIILEKNVQGEKRYSRREYIAKRDFDDAEKTPGVIKRRKKEELAIKKLGDKMDSKFWLALSGDGSNPDEMHIKIDDMIRKNTAKRKLAEKADAEMIQLRTRHIQRMLQKTGVAKKDWGKYVDRFKWIMAEMRDVNEEMNSDKRAENMRINLENFGVKTWEEALLTLEKEGGDLTKTLAVNKISDAQKLYDKRLKKLEEFDKGKYAAFAAQMAKIPDCYAAMMSKDEKVFTDYMKNEMAPRLKNLVEGIEKAKKAGNAPVIDATVSQYCFSYLRNIYDGDIKGDAGYFQGVIEDHTKKTFAQYNGNINAAKNEIKKILKGQGLKDAVINQHLALFQYNLVYSVNSFEEFKVFTDKNKLIAWAKKLYDETKKQNESDKRKTKRDQERDKLIKQITRKADMDSASKDEEKGLREDIKKQREKGKVVRMKYLGIDDGSLNKVRLNGSLVRVKQNGRETVTLTHSTVNKMREYVDKYAGTVKIPQVLKDALIEEGASSGGEDRGLGIYEDDELLYKHAAAMEMMYSMLQTEAPDDAAMSEEEAQMYIVCLYGDMSKRSLFEDNNKLNIAELRKGESYKVFRDNYAKIKALEETKFDELYIKGEQSEISRNLRTMLITGAGFLDENKKAVRFGKLKDDQKLEYQKKLGDMITRQAGFLKASQKLSEMIRAHFMVLNEESKKYKMSMETMDRNVNGIKEYFLEDLIKDLEKGADLESAKWADTWNGKIFDFIKDEKNMRNLDGIGMTVDDKAQKELEQQRSDTRLGEKDLEDVIKSSVIFFKGKENKYEKLDNNQKKLFAIALMMMDKGAIGIGTMGTSALLSGKSVKKETADEIARQIDTYVKGGKLDVKVDYKEAFFKLVNYGDAGIFGLTDSYVMSDTAYEKAMLFVKAITTKKEAYGEKDVKRISDGYSSIYAAYANHDKKQQHEVDKLRGVSLTIQDVRDKLLQYAENDKISGKRIGIKAAIVGVGAATMATGMALKSAADSEAAAEAKKTGKTVRVDSKKKGVNAAIIVAGAPALIAGNLDEDITVKYNLANVQKRLKALDDTQLKMFLRLMQERSVVDITTGEGKDKKVRADQAKSNALKEALSGSQMNEVLEGFDESDSCLQAMVSALSFQLKDNVNFKGKPLTKGYFESESFKRETLVDWKLIINALDMLDEIEAKRNEIEALKNAYKFIDMSGNKKAIEMHKELEHDFKDKKDKFSDFHFDRLISSKVDSEGNETIKNAYAGFMKLDEREKNLFYKVLARRDLLDISKKNYVTNFFGLDERGYLNEADRFKLIDQYIISSLNDNIGLQADGEARYLAMENLLSTQVSDRVDFKKEKDLESIFSHERGFLFSRGTAIDWKLFQRALNFVTRATRELEKTEGNAMIYRGAGDLSEQGAMKMDYSFLRKNFHRTGNRWTRYIGRKLAKEVKDDLRIDKYLDTIVGYINTADSAFGSLGFKEDGLVRKGIGKLKKVGADAKSLSKQIDKNPALMNVTAVDVKEKEKTKEEKDKEKQKEAKRREELLFYQHMKEGMDNIVAMKNSSREAATEIAAFLKKNLVTKFVNEKHLSDVSGKEAKADEENIVEKSTKGVTKDSSYGDSRDYKAKVESYQKKVKNYYNIVTGVPGLQDIAELARYGANLLVYRFINEKYVNAEIKDDDDELKQLQSAADKYFKKTFDEMVISVVGEQNAKDLLEGENSIYNIKDTVTKTAKSIMKGVKFAKKCVAHIENIASSIENKQLLSRNEKDAAGQQAADRKKLKDAKENRLDAHGAKLMEQQHKANKAEVALGKTITNTVQNFNIAEDVMNLVIETTNYAGLKLNVGQEAIQRAIKAGIEFAMYAARVATDRDSLTDYYLTTDAGKQEIAKIRTGFLKARQNDKVDKIDKALESYKMNIKDNAMGLVDIIADVNGYEHTSELMEDTAMQMAQSIVFAASNYNPMMETKIMATSVMVVMGLGKEVGNTTPDTVEKLFKSFKMPV